MTVLLEDIYKEIIESLENSKDVNDLKRNLANKLDAFPNRKLSPIRNDITSKFLKCKKLSNLIDYLESLEKEYNGDLQIVFKVKEWIGGDSRVYTRWYGYPSSDTLKIKVGDRGILKVFKAKLYEWNKLRSIVRKLKEHMITYGDDDISIDVKVKTNKGYKWIKANSEIFKITLYEPRTYFKLAKDDFLNSRDVIDTNGLPDYDKLVKKV